MLSFGFRIFCWYRGFCHRTGSDLLLFLSVMNANRELQNENDSNPGPSAYEATSLSVALLQ